jgi:hypothetical protein
MNGEGRSSVGFTEQGKIIWHQIDSGYIVYICLLFIDGIMYRCIALTETGEGSLALIYLHDKIIYG